MLLSLRPMTQVSWLSDEVSFWRSSILQQWSWCLAKMCMVICTGVRNAHLQSSPTWRRLVWVGTFHAAPLTRSRWDETFTGAWLGRSRVQVASRASVSWMCWSIKGLPVPRWDTLRHQLATRQVQRCGFRSDCSWLLFHGRLRNN